MPKIPKAHSIIVTVPPAAKTRDREQLRIIHHRVRGAGLDQRECRSGYCGEREGAEDQDRGPALVVPFDQRVGQGEQRHGRGDEAGEVQVPLHRRIPGLIHEGHGDREGDDPDRHVNEEDPAPVQMLADETADQRAERQCHRADRRPDPDRRGALPGVLERRHDDRQRGRDDEGGAQALHQPGRDQDSTAASQTCAEGCQREDGQPGQEQPPPSEQVSQPATGQQEAGEHQDVAADYPFQACEGQVQAALDGGYRDIGHVVVEVGHEGGE